MTSKELFNIFREAACEVYDRREAVSVAHTMLEDLAGISRTRLFLYPDAEIDVPADMERILGELRSGRPVQYITGRCEFNGLEFRVREGVLIPRPETEELVELVAAENAGVRSVLDIGTGSGAIAVSLAKLLPEACVRATDISPEALAIARGNAVANGVDVEFFQADILSESSDWEGTWADAMFDIIVSNPPYIPAGDIPFMHRNVVGYDPHIALFVPDFDPLVFYRAIAGHAVRLLAPGGGLYFEIYEHFAEEMRGLLEGFGFADIEVIRDINGKNRIVRCRKR